MDLADLLTKILDLSEETDSDTFLTAIDAVNVAKTKLKEIDTALKEAFELYYNKNGPLELDETTSYIMKTAKTIKCVNPYETFETLLGCTDGDIEAVVANFLSSNPFKHGSIKSAIRPEQFDELFQVEERKSIDTGNTKRQMAKWDKQFTK